MRRLRDLQTVTLDTGRIPLVAVVAATLGGIAYLQVDPRHITDELELPSRAHLGFTYEGRPVMLVGVLNRGGSRPGLLAFGANASGMLPNLRSGPRLALGLEVEVTPEGGAARTAQTIDVSAGGLLVANALGTPGTGVEVRLKVPGKPEPVRARATVVAVRAEGTAVVFTEIDPMDRALLETLVLSVRAEIASRVLQRM